MPDTITTPNRVEADLIIRHEVAEYITEFGTDFCGPFNVLRLQLSQKVGHVLQEDWLKETIEHMDHVARAEDGSHYDLKINRARTVDNQNELIEHWSSELTVTINHLLDYSGLPYGWVNGTGTDTATKAA